MRTNRHADHPREAAVAAFLDRFLYAKLDADPERQEDTATQRSGVDVIADIPSVGRRLDIDEKAQLDYCNDPLPTFALEIDSIQGDTKREGWLFGESYETQYYLFVWLPDILTFRRLATPYGERLVLERGSGNDAETELEALATDIRATVADEQSTFVHTMFRDTATLRADADVDDIRGPRVEIEPTVEVLTALEARTGAVPDAVRQPGKVAIRWFETEHIQRADCLLIERDALQTYFEDSGFGRERSNEIAADLRDRDEYEKHQVEKDAFYFYYTPPYRKGEEPINIVMYKRQFESLADEQFVVTRDGIR